MSTGQDKKYIDNYDETEVYSPNLPEGWLEVASDGQHYLKHPNMPQYRDPAIPGKGDGALGIFNPFNLNLGGDSTATEDGKHFVEETYGMYGAAVENWYNKAQEKIDDFKATIDDLKTLWDGRPWPVAVVAGLAATTTGTPTSYDGTGSTGGGPSGIVAWLWEPEGGTFVGGTAADDDIVSIEWPTVGAKDVRLIVTDEYGRQDISTLEVTVS